jgi:hypothetical protein
MASRVKKGSAPFWLLSEVMKPVGGQPRPAGKPGFIAQHDQQDGILSTACAPPTRKLTTIGRTHPAGAGPVATALRRAVESGSGSESGTSGEEDILSQIETVRQVAVWSGVEWSYI